MKEVEGLRAIISLNSSIQYKKSQIAVTGSKMLSSEIYHTDSSSASLTLNMLQCLCLKNSSIELNHI